MLIACGNFFRRMIDFTSYHTLMVGVTGTEALMNIAGKMCHNSVAGVIFHCSSSSYDLMKLMPYIAFPALK